MATAGNGRWDYNVKDRQCFTRFNKQGKKYTACKDNKQQLRMASANTSAGYSKPRVKPTRVKKPKGTIVKPKAADKPKKPKAPTKPARPRGRPKAPPKAKPPPKKRGRKSLGITAARRVAQDKKTAELKAKRAEKAAALKEKRAKKAEQVKRNKAIEAERLKKQRAREAVKREKRLEEEQEAEWAEIFERSKRRQEQLEAGYLKKRDVVEVELMPTNAFKVPSMFNDSYELDNGNPLDKENLMIDPNTNKIYRVSDEEFMGKWQPKRKVYEIRLDGWEQGGRILSFDATKAGLEPY